MLFYANALLVIQNIKGYYAVAASSGLLHFKHVMQGHHTEARQASVSVSLSNS